MKFLIIDDHPLLREGVAAVLQQLADPVQVLHAADGLAGLALADAHDDLDAALVDLRMAGLDGLTTVARLHDHHPALPVVMLSSSEDPADVRRALAAGARGYCPKSAGHATLLAALRLVMAGELYLPPLMAAEVSQARAVPPRPRLTDRQAEVLGLLCEGQPNKVISQRLGLSEKTTKAHVTAIFKSLGVVNRTQAVLAAKAAGMDPAG